jgi:hypothetical protein
MRGICFSPTAFCFLPSVFCLLLTADAYCIQDSRYRLREGKNKIQDSGSRWRRVSFFRDSAAFPSPPVNAHLTVLQAEPPSPALRIWQSDDVWSH